MPEMSYTTNDLRTGGRHAHAAAGHAESAATALDRVGGSTPFGNVTGSGELHGAVGMARDHHRAGARTVAQDAHAASQRATGAARLGDHNTHETTRVAPRSEGAAAVRAGM